MRRAAAEVVRSTTIIEIALKMPKKTTKRMMPRMKAN